MYFAITNTNNCKETVVNTNNLINLMDFIFAELLPKCKVAERFHSSEKNKHMKPIMLNMKRVCSLLAAHRS